MLFEDKEINLIEDFILVTNHFDESVCLFPNSDDTHSIVCSIADNDKWKTEWVDNSAKNAPPPDFYNDKLKLMLEVMRVDDHAFEKNGKVQNPTNQKARECEKEIKQLIENGILNVAPNCNVFVNSPTDLPSLEDHNYRFYKSNFKRIIEKHKEKIDLYKKNHPDYKLIFYIFDESSMYCKINSINKSIKQGEQFECELHFWFLDREFVEVFKNSGIDFLIWFTPYKRLEAVYPPINLPKAIVYDCQKTNDELIDYPEDYMMSTEE